MTRLVFVFKLQFQTIHNTSIIFRCSKNQHKNICLSFKSKAYFNYNEPTPISMHQAAHYSQKLETSSNMATLNHFRFLPNDHFLN